MHVLCLFNKNDTKLTTKVLFKWTKIKSNLNGNNIYEITLVGSLEVKKLGSQVNQNGKRTTSEAFIWRWPILSLPLESPMWENLRLIVIGQIPRTQLLWDMDSFVFVPFTFFLIYPTHTNYILNTKLNINLQNLKG